MINVPQKCYNRRPPHESSLFASIEVFNQFLLSSLCEFHVQFDIIIDDNHLSGLNVESLIDRGHHTCGEQLLDDLIRLDSGGG